MKKSKMVIRDNYYYKYICIWNNKTQRKKQIPFKLAHKDDYNTAHRRKAIVENRAEQFKRDNQSHLLIGYKFDWETENGKEEIKPPLTLKEGIDLYLSQMMKLRRVNTIDMYVHSFNHLIDFFEPNKICSEITSKNLLDYVVKMKGDRSDTSINMDLRSLRTMLYYCRDIENITLKRNLSFKLAFKECPINDKDPIYITEVEFNKIMEEDWCLLYSDKRDWYKEVFQLYWDLGIRLTEGFKGIIKGNCLFVPQEVAKNGIERDVIITPKQKNTIEKMQRIYKEQGSSKWHIRGYSKMFKKVLRKLHIDESKHFHCLRHSYGIRRRLETNGNIPLIQDEMGHKDINSTIKYQRCNAKKLKYDFPSFREVLESLENGAKTPTSTSKTSTSNRYGEYSNSRVLN